jgi:hypothetical protein
MLVKFFENFEVDFEGVSGLARGCRTGFELVVYVAH